MNVHYLFALCGMFLLLSCKGVAKQKNVPFSEEYPFRGVWINDDSENYFQLKLDLYSKSVHFSDNTEASFGFLDVENEFVGDYCIITDVLSIEKDKAEVMTYSLRYGDPNDKTKLTLLFDRTNGSLKWDESLIFSKDSACRYVEVQKQNVNVRTTPIDGTPIILANQGQMMELLDFDRGWYKIRLNDGQEGYISDDLSEAVKSNIIPLKTFEEIYSNTDPNTPWGTISFKVEGDKVLMVRDYCSTPMEENNWQSVYQSSTVFYGTINGNSLMFIKSLDIFMPDLENIAPSDMKKIEPYPAYYSSIEKGFFFEGTLFKP